MGLEAAFFLGAFVLLVAIIYGVISSRYRNRALDPIRDEATRNQYRRAGDDGSAPVAPSEASVTPFDSSTREPNGREPALSEEDIQRAQFGPRGVAGAADPAKMTPQRALKTPGHIDPGHVS